jgi:hypothetical protein
MTLAALALWTGLLAVGGAVVCAAPDAVAALRCLSARVVLSASGVAVLAWALRVGMVPAYGRIQTDEAYYAAIAGMFVRDGVVWSDGYAKAFGWPALLVPAFAVAGRSAAVAVGWSTALGVATSAGLTAWIGARTGRVAAGVTAGGLVALWPLHAQWSRSAESMVAGGALVVALAAAAQAHGRRPGLRRGLGVACLAALAISVRPEAVAVVAALAVARPGRGALLAGAALAAPNLAAYARVHADTNLDLAGAVGWSAWSMPWTAWVGTPLHPWPLAVAALVGWVAIARLRPREAGAWVVALAGSLAVLSAAGVGALASPSRLLIVPGVVGAALAGAGVATMPVRAGWVAASLALGALAATSADGWRAAGRDLPTYRLQHTLPARVAADVPTGCTLVAALPVFYAGLVDVPVAGPEALDDPGACRVFVVDLPCLEWRGGRFDAACARGAAGPEIARYEVADDGGSAQRAARLHAVGGAVE